MAVNHFRFAIASDLHIALPHTVWEHPSRFHLVEYSIEAFEVVLAHLCTLELDFLLIPGDLTQHGEPENHQWLAHRLAQLPFPAYVIPGNHDLPTPAHFAPFLQFYRDYGYGWNQQPYYSLHPLPGIRLIGLNSNFFTPTGEQIGYLDQAQMDWLSQELPKSKDLTLVMIHHNLIEHMPGQGSNPLGQRYMLENRTPVCELLHQAGVQLLFTGHLHVQDIAYSDRFQMYEITTGSTVSFPHPYRLLEYRDRTLSITSHRVEQIPSLANLSEFSRTWMGDRAHAFIAKLLMAPPLGLSREETNVLLPDLRYFWADLAAGDAQFNFVHFPEPARSFLEAFSDRPPADNQVILDLS
ncbi:MAG: metallophosphoesterase [Pseudanabaenaceae cyanobacterium bins.68]|nr:metallophosphoesterase [Pseudanabaenaceae cyanobacterium bins.68]